MREVNCERKWRAQIKAPDTWLSQLSRWARAFLIDHRSESEAVEDIWLLRIAVHMQVYGTPRAHAERENIDRPEASRLVSFCLVTSRLGGATDWLFTSFCEEIWHKLLRHSSLYYSTNTVLCDHSISTIQRHKWTVFELNESSDDKWTLASDERT